jgi:SAM-dependent methyltransferase
MEKIERAMSILRCPRSGTSLSLEGSVIKSASGETYPIIAGKPILVRHVEPMHIENPTEGIVSQNIASYSPPDVKGWKLHLGSGNVPCSDPDVLSLDILPLPNVDVVCEAEALPFATDAISHVTSGAVFEHLYNPLKAIAEVRRVLREGGNLHIDTAFMQSYHGFPSHYFNMTPQACETFLVDDFILNYSTVPLSGSPIFGIETTIRRLLDALPRAEADRILRLSLKDFLEETPALQSAEWFNMIPEHIKRSLASSVIVGARKPADYERRRAAMLNEVGEDRLARVKRGYYAARVAVIAMHYEVLFYRERAERRGADCRDYPLPAAVSIYLERGRIDDPLVFAKWEVAAQELRNGVTELAALRERYIVAYVGSPASLRSAGA